MSTSIVACSVRIAKDFTPRTFGRLTTLGPEFRVRRGPEINGRSGNLVKGRTDLVQVCECTCGTIDIYFVSNFTKGKSASCGCYKVERIKETKITHGMRQDPHYAVYMTILARCYNPNTKQYKDYGGRGVGVCDEWRTRNAGFMAWYTYMGPRPTDRHTIDRFPNPDGNYEPGNVRWATYEEQANNKSDNHLLTHNDRTQTTAQWAKELGVNPQTFYSRIQRGWTDEEILTTTVKKAAQ